MSEYSDIAGSEDIISLNYETQETLNEHSYRTKQSASRTDKAAPVEDQAKENQKPTEEVADAESDVMQAETQNYSQTTIGNGGTIEQPPPAVDTQNTLTSDNPLVARLPLAQSTLTDGSSISADKDSMIEEAAVQEENNVANESASKPKTDANATGLDASTTANNIHLYISPSTSLLETTNVDDAQLNPLYSVPSDNVEIIPEADDKPKEEPMDTSDAQVSLGSDGIIESHPAPAPTHDSASATEKSTTVSPPVQNRTPISPHSKALYAFSQPTTEKFEAILAKLTAPGASHEVESNVAIREEEELVVKESVCKTVRRYAVKLDRHGRVLSRDLLVERLIEENTTTRVEAWPPAEKKDVQSQAETTRPPAQTVRPAAETAQPTERKRKKSAKLVVPKRRTKSLKPTATVVSPKKSRPTRSMSDDDDVIAIDADEESSDNDNEDDAPTDDVSGDEFIPNNSSGESLKKDARVFAKWRDGNFYPGVIRNTNGTKYLVEYDDGAKRPVKAQDIICRSYLDAEQKVLVQIKEEHFERGTVKRLIKKKKTGNVGYVVEIDGKEKWYPLRFISLSTKQAQKLSVVVNNNTEEPAPASQGKRKRTSTAPQSPNKRTRSSVTTSPNKSQRTTSTPTRQTKLFNSKHFLLTGFNESMDTRAEIQNAIESHGGRVIEKMPKPNRRENTFLISDKARKTAKFVEAKKLNIPCVNYQWINESIEKGELQECDDYKLSVSEKDAKGNEDNEE